MSESRFNSMSKCIRRRLDLGERSYDVLIAEGELERLGSHLLEIPIKGRVAVLTNPRIDRLYGERVMTGLQTAGFNPLMIHVPAGERYKTPRQIGKIYDQLISNRFERSDTLIALGGGVIGDMCGFAAAIYLRGIAYIQCPTTVVAQVDASIGGKTGVDHPEGKNLIGAFHQPKLVCSDPSVLKTLSKREYRAGLAEVVKYGVIADASFFAFLEANAEKICALEPEALLHCIDRSSTLKLEIVQSDEQESGRRKILNYGHTFGHAIETLTGYSQYRHGEGVAIGMVLASRMAERLGLLDPVAVKRQIALLKAFGLPTDLPKLPPEDILRVMASDKKVVGGEIYFILPERIGSVRIMPVSRKELSVFLTSLHRSHS